MNLLLVDHGGRQRTTADILQSAVYIYIYIYIYIAIRCGSLPSVVVHHGPLWSAAARRGTLWSAAVDCGPLRSTVVRCGPSWSTVVRCDRPCSYGLGVDIYIYIIVHMDDEHIILMLQNNIVSVDRSITNSNCIFLTSIL